MIDKKILAKIRKCLALSRSANEHEASNALAMARKLMDEHGVSPESIDINEAGAQSSKAQRPPNYEAVIYELICAAFGCKCYLVPGVGVKFIGVSYRPEVASYAFNQVFRLIKRHRADYIRTKLKRCSLKVKRVRADHFCEGWVRGLEMALICTQEPIDCAIAKAHLEEMDTTRLKARGAGKTRSQLTHSDFRAGEKTGEQVRLATGINGSNAEPLMIGGQ